MRTILKVAGALSVLTIFALVAIVALVDFPEFLPPFAPSGLRSLLPPVLPEPRPPAAAHWLEQNWTDEDRLWFHHASQGTATFPVPYAWFVALEQPGFGLIEAPGLLKDAGYLSRFGFIPSPQTGSADNTDGLPVGFARAVTAAPHDQIGLTCSGCHTGHIEYKGVSIRFDGGPAMIDLGKLAQATAMAVFYTLNWPPRFHRFADRVLGPGASDADRASLKSELAKTWSRIVARRKAFANVAKAPGELVPEEGFGRLDALNRIGNDVFYFDLATSNVADLTQNLRVPDAPVSFPPIWTAPWFLWAQYDASIEQPLVRNLSEALGVGASVTLAEGGDPAARFRSSVPLENLVRMENLLRGPNPFAAGSDARPVFAGLLSPKWPEALFPGDAAWKIDENRVARGRALYAEICVECHLGPVNDPQFDQEYPDKSFWASDHWRPEGPGGEKVLDLKQKSAAGMGVDPARANVLATRMIDVRGALGIDPQNDLRDIWGCQDAIPADRGPKTPFAPALMDVAGHVIEKWMDDNKVAASDRQEIMGPRKNCPNPGAEPVYRPRPLNGVWATAPYLHNGSVPSLYWMLKPAAQRPKQFCVGASDFDPRLVGYPAPEDGKPDCARGETLFSTTDAGGREFNGNGNPGHSLEGRVRPGLDYPDGVIGRELSEEERFDLIEYLKTL